MSCSSSEWQKHLQSSTVLATSSVPYMLRTVQQVMCPVGRHTWRSCGAHFVWPHSLRRIPVLEFSFHFLRCVSHILEPRRGVDVGFKDSLYKWSWQEILPSFNLREPRINLTCREWGIHRLEKHCQRCRLDRSVWFTYPFSEDNKESDEHFWVDLRKKYGSGEIANKCVNDQTSISRWWLYISHGPSF